MIYILNECVDNRSSVCLMDCNIDNLIRYITTATSNFLSSYLIKIE